MQEKWSAFTSAVVLGLIVTIWHLPLYAFLIDDPVEFAAQATFPLALRIWVVWLYANTGKSIFATIVFHAVFNLGYAVLPANLPIVTALSLGVALALPLLWGSATLAHLKAAHRQVPIRPGRLNNRGASTSERSRQKRTSGTEV